MNEYVTSACVYSSETGRWGEPTLLPGEIGNFTFYSSVLVGNSLLYFLSNGEAIQEYDLARHSLTVFGTPDDSFEQKFNLMLSENGELVVSESVNLRLNLWSRELSGGTGAQWVLSRVIYFENLFPNGALVDPVDVGFAEGANAIFVSTADDLFMIELESDQIRKVGDHHGFCNLIPVVGFYTPLPQDQRPNVPPPSPSEEAGGDDGGDEEKTVYQAQQLFDNGSHAIKEGDFVNTFECVSHDLKIRVPSDKEVTLECASTEYGCAKSVPNEESVTSAANKDYAGNSKTSHSDFEDAAAPSRKGDLEEGI